MSNSISGHHSYLGEGDDSWIAEHDHVSPKTDRDSYNLTEL